MKASWVINHLQQLVAEHGDLDVVIYKDIDIPINNIEFNDDEEPAFIIDITSETLSEPFVASEGWREEQ